MANLWTQFRDLLPADPLLVGTVDAHNADGTSTIVLPDGASLRVRGQDVALGLRAYVQSGRVQGQAPNLPSVQVSV